MAADDDGVARVADAVIRDIRARQSCLAGALLQFCISTSYLRSSFFTSASEVVLFLRTSDLWNGRCTIFG